MNFRLPRLIKEELNAESITDLANHFGSSPQNLCSVLSETVNYLADQVCLYLEYNEKPWELLSLIHKTPTFDLHTPPAGSVLEKIENEQLVTHFLTKIIPDTVPEGSGNTPSIFGGISTDNINSVTALSAALLLKSMKRYLQSRTTESISLKQWLTSSRREIPTEQHNKQHTLDAEGNNDTKNTGKKSYKPLWFLLALLTLLLIMFLLRSCPVSSDKNAFSVTHADLGEFTEHTLPDGNVIDIPEKGIENKLLSFIRSDKPVDSELWFSFDRLSFEKNSAILRPDSNEQLSNIVKIMNAYPEVRLKLGGYTDNSGTAEVNNKLSGERAETVRQALTDKGVSAERLDAKGYGSLFPIAPNDTEENRAKNRRIDIQVIRK